MKMNNMSKNELEMCRELIRHAIGMDNRDTYIRHGKKFYKPYRNYFQTGIECHDYHLWEKMVETGFAERTKKDEHGNAWYRITRSGMNWIEMIDKVHIHDLRY